MLWLTYLFTINAKFVTYFYDNTNLRITFCGLHSYVYNSLPRFVENGQLGLQYPQCPLFPTWCCPFVTFVEHQGLSLPISDMQWLYLLPLYLKGKMHLLPVLPLPPPTVIHSCNAMYNDKTLKRASIIIVQN